MPHIDTGEALREKVLAFFATNPDETLTGADISRKFAVGIRLVPPALVPAVAAGTLRLNSHGEYSAGQPQRQSPQQPPVRSPNPAPAAKPRTPRPPPVMPPPDSLRIEPDVPLPTRTYPRGKASPYAATFEAMKPGDSVAVPTPAAKRLIAVAQYLGKKLGRTYQHRQLGGGNSRIWRIK